MPVSKENSRSAFASRLDSNVGLYEFLNTGFHSVLRFLLLGAVGATMVLSCATTPAPPAEAALPPGGPAGAVLSQLTPRRAVDARAFTVNRMLERMTLEEQIGQMIMPGLLYDRRGRTVQAMDEELRALIREVKPGGFVLFGPNIATPEQVRALVVALQAESRVPMIIATDQEGGVVRRIPSNAVMPATSIPAARTIGRTSDLDLAYQIARVNARELRSLGITLNFAPVADVFTNPQNPIVGSRAFGTEAVAVAEMVEATVRGFQDEGVSASLKHFPGHGDTLEDSHEEATSVPHGIERLRAVELIPFERGIRAGADTVMIGHIGAPSVSGSSLPATLDRQIVTTLLREQLGFEGVIVTDSLIMAGITRYYGERAIVVGAVRAGADILLRPARPAAAVQYLLDAVERGELSRERIAESVRRILLLKMERGLIAPPTVEAGTLGFRRVEQPGALYSIPQYYVPPEHRLGLPEHRRLAEEVRRRAAQSGG